MKKIFQKVIFNLLTNFFYTNFNFLFFDKIEMLGLKENGAKISKSMLYDHCTLPLGEDDYLRISQIPRKKVRALY